MSLAKQLSPMIERSVTHRNLLRSTIAAAVVTAVFYFAEGDWSSALANGEWPMAIFSYLFAVVIALIPYGALVLLLRRARHAPGFQVVAFVPVVALPIIGFGYWRLNEIPTGGVDYLIVPFLQLVLIGILRGLCALFIAAADQSPAAVGVGHDTGHQHGHL